MNAVSPHTEDVCGGKAANALLAGDTQLLEMISRGESLFSILDVLCRLVEEMSTGALCSILLLDAGGERLWHGAAPSLPGSFTGAISGGCIGPNVASCGSAAYRKQPVIVADIASDPLWAEYRDLALAHGLRACWSVPIFSPSGAVLGTFAIYSRQPCSPTAQQLKIIDHFAHLASVAIERTRADEALRNSEAYLAEAQLISQTGSFGWKVASGEIIWSDETYRIMGCERGLKPTLDLILQRIHPEDVSFVKNMLASSIRDGTNLDFEHRLLMPDGAVKCVRVLARATKDARGNSEFIGAVMDVTRRKQAEAALRGSEQLARGQVEALTRTLDALARESAPDRLVEHVLRTIAEQLGAHSIGVWMRDAPAELVEFESAFENGRLVTKSESDIAAISPPMRIDDVWPWPEVFRSGKSSVLEDIREGPMFPWRDHLLKLGIITVLVVPMSIAGEVAGAIGIRFTRKREFKTKEMELAQALANQAMLAIQLIRLSAQSRDAAVVAERIRMAREIHDTLAQGLTGIIVQLEAAEDAMSQDLKAESQNHLKRAATLAREGLREARWSVQALRPLALQEKNLCAAMKELFDKMTVGTSLRANFATSGGRCDLAPDREENLLRIGQEVLTNAIRHARATEFDARLIFRDHEIHLALRDNGRGFDLKSKRDGFGLIGIRERVEAMGGRLTIETAKGKGTAVIIVLPSANPP